MPHLMMEQGLQGSLLTGSATLQNKCSNLTILVKNSPSGTSWHSSIHRKMRMRRYAWASKLVFQAPNFPLSIKSNDFFAISLASHLSSVICASTRVLLLSVLMQISIPAPNVVSHASTSFGRLEETNTHAQCFTLFPLAPTPGPLATS